MSPNLLWAPESPDADYMQKVNSTAAVNAIVEAIVSDWSYFFHDEFTLNDFYVTFTRDDLFPDNGGFSIHHRDSDAAHESLMTKSMHASSVSGVDGRSLHVQNNYLTHSRSSSHETNSILLEHNSDDSIALAKRSQSNSSLSDSSPPQQNSPKLPLRRKHNKQVAPTPPDHRYSHHPSGGYSLARSLTESKERFFRGFNNDEDNGQPTGAGTYVTRPPLQQHTLTKQRTGSSENLFVKPEKPPRPAMPAAIESQTLVRNAFKAKGLDKHGKPVALPRNLLQVARSTENLSTTKDSGPNCSDSGDELEPVLLRENHHHHLLGEKPAIPERPSSLIRSSYRAPVFEKFADSQSSGDSGGGGGGVKKAQSFRMSGSGSPSSSSQKSFVIASSPGRSLTTAHIYNVDKQQVAIIDVSDGSNGGNGKPADTPTCKREVSATLSAPLSADHAKDDKPVKELPSSASLDAPPTSSTPVGPEGMPPPSPQSKVMIKRPQTPAPPPPKNATHSSSTERIDTVAMTTTTTTINNILPLSTTTNTTTTSSSSSSSSSASPLAQSSNNNSNCQSATTPAPGPTSPAADTTKL